MKTKVIRKLTSWAAAIGMVAGIGTAPIHASGNGYLVAGLSVDASKLTNAQLEFHDSEGVIVGTCYADVVRVKDGNAEFPCDFYGYAKSADLVTLSSDQVDDTFGVTGVGGNSIALENLSAATTGWFSVDLGGNLPTF